jgi:fumarate reductase flavoprotein subunit
LVEVVPTAHYMMGGVVFRADCTTELPGLFAAGEDTGGVHGANRLGGNGVANSTVFGGIAGETIAAWLDQNPESQAPDDEAIIASVVAHEAPFRQVAGNIESIREALHDCMWNDVGILRSAAGLKRALVDLDQLDALLSETGVADDDRRYNLTWHDWINLRSLLAVSRAIATAALAREDSRGAHYREDFPARTPLSTSDYTLARESARAIAIARLPVRFTRLTPAQP